MEIDCDHDFERHGTKPRITARASGVEHLKLIDAQLQAIPDSAHEARILNMHGSPHYKDGLLKICEMMHDAHKALDSFCVAHDVKAILCGHIHSSYLGPIVWPVNPINATEFCCGTSSQVVNPPINPVTRSLVGRYLPRVNQALVHQIVRKGKMLLWEVAEYSLKDQETEFKAGNIVHSIRI